MHTTINLASCDSVRKNIQDASHVIYYLHLILSVSCILTLCRYIVQKVVQKVNDDMFWRDFSCVHTVGLF